jgi:hypothetical protein
MRRAISRVALRLPPVAAVVIAGAVIAACGSGSASSSSASASNSSASASSGANSSQTQLQEEALHFARCMRSHGVSNFPDPAANGPAFDISGINQSSPAFKAAQTACKTLEPVKQAPSEPPTPQAYDRLVHWAECMRRHGIAGMPDPRPNPPPGPNSPSANLYGTLMGDGGYWVGIPNSVNAHSPAFTRLSTACGEAP